MRSGIRVALVALALTTSAGPALGDEQEEARRLMEEGVSADQSGDKERAVELFKQSLALHPSYDVAGNLGLVEFGLERYAAAANHLSYCLRHFASGQKRELRELIEQKLSVAKQYVSEVSIVASEPHAEVRVGQEVVGLSPLGFAVFVEPGTVEFSAKVGDRTVRTSQELSPKDRAEVRLDLPVETSAASTVGKYEPVAQRSAPWWPAAVGGGLTLASLGVTITARVMAEAEQDELADLRSMLGSSDCYGSNTPAVCDDIERAESRYETRATVADVSLVTTAVFGAATIGYVSYVLVQRGRRAKRADTAVVPVPIVTDGGVGLLLEGKF